MQSRRLEQLDSYQRSFTSHVIAVDNDWLALAESLFYPSSGGQEFDTGKLNEVTIKNVEKRDELVWHQLERHVFQVGDELCGQIDWPRRFRHMQRHSGQHLLSQAFIRVNPAFETKSVSLTSSTCTIDFAANPELSDLLTAEALVNEIVYSNLEIKAFEVDDSELSHYPLRRPPKVKGRIRLVQMGDWELSACGGTHVKQSSEVAPIKILKSERIRSGLTRVSFKVGLEAIEDYAEKHNVTQQLSQSLSAQVPQLLTHVTRLKEELKAAQYKGQLLEQEKAKQLATQLLQNATTVNKLSIISHVLEAHEANLLNNLAKELSQHPNNIVLLAAKAETRVNLLFCRHADLEHDMNKVLKQALPIVEGRGGGKPDKAQGSGTKLESVEEALSSALTYLLD